VRACYAPELNLESTQAVIEGEKLHHLRNVVRIKEGEEILILNGNGSGRVYSVLEMRKKSISLQSSSEIIIKENSLGIDLCIGKVKKDAMDLIFKQACEMGIERVYIVESEYAQNYPLKEERIDKLLISGIEQSNNYWLPQVIETSLDEMSSSGYQSVVLATPGGQKTLKKIEGRILLLIGPEGGFSEAETSQILAIENIHQLHLEMNILRAPTAVTCAVGYLHGLML
jgi:16S rRNA (uracil1498-N3)-methyltransferase